MRARKLSGAISLLAAVVVGVAVHAPAAVADHPEYYEFLDEVKRVVDTNEHLVEFKNGDYSQVWHRWQLSPGGSWSSWVSLGTRKIVGSPFPVVRTDGILVVFAIDAFTKELIHKWQLCDGCSWSEWSGLGGIATSNPSVIRLPDNSMMVFVKGAGDMGDIYYRWQYCDGCSWASWVGLSNPGVRLTSFPRTTYNNGCAFVDAVDIDHYVWSRADCGAGWSPWS